MRTILSKYGFAFQRELFPTLEEELGPLGERYELFVTVLGFVQVEPFLTGLRGLPGRPQADRAALARAFIAKACPVLDTGAVFAITTTRALIERLAIDRSLRRLCGWSQSGEVPWSATSHAIRRPSKGARNQRRSLRNRPPRNGGVVVHERACPELDSGVSNGPRRRLARQLQMTPAQMLDELPRTCDVGVKQDAKGHRQS